MFYRTCPCCGSNLDPGEKCECRDVARKKKERITSLFENGSDGQIKMRLEDVEYGS